MVSQKFPEVETLWKHTVSTEFWMGNSAETGRLHKISTQEN